MSETCNACKWWSGPTKIKEFYNPHGAAECKCPKMVGGEIDGIEDAIGGGTLITGPDFGCVHWEKKSDT